MRVLALMTAAVAVGVVTTTVVAVGMAAVADESGIARGDEALERLLAEKGVRGTIVVASLDGSRIWVANPERANQRFLPASTFKIPNTLIALEQGAIREDEVVRWDGRTHPIAEWNRDQTLASAFSTSCVWFYQDLARRVGAETYRSLLAQIRYGNGEPGPELTTFWLDGDLRISANEQIAFLRALVRRELPFSSATYDVLARVMIADQAPATTLRAKTGWAARVTPQIGWYVGTLERGEEVWLFAVNLEIRSPQDLPLRRALALAALRAKGLMDAGDASPDSH